VYVASGNDFSCVELQTASGVDAALSKVTGKVDYCSPIVSDGKIIQVIFGGERYKDWAKDAW